jgi:hypothetical protein
MLNGDLDPKVSTFLIPYLLVAWNRLHHLYRSPSELSQPPYDHTVPPLFDGRHTGQQLFAATPSTLAALLTPHGLELLRHPTGRFAAALRTLDSVCRDWVPRVPVRLYFASGDEQVSTTNTAHCLDALTAHHARVRPMDLGTPDYQGSRHLGSNVAAPAEIAYWFSSLH